MIMDGNKRWANTNGVSLKIGYQKGLDKLKEIVTICLEQKIKHLTVYALSTENIRRTSVSIIFNIIKYANNKIIEEFSFQKEIRIKIIGEKKNLPPTIQKEFLDIEKITKNNKKLNLNIAFNYGTNIEFLEIVKKIVSLYGNKEKKITDTILKKHMYLQNVPDPDLLIRTGGFQRLSNFILLNLGYTEIFFTKTLWPDLSKKEILKIFDNYYKIERKYGL
jgi:undecaprenyl diphosphate synthase